MMQGRFFTKAMAGMTLAAALLAPTAVHAQAPAAEAAAPPDFNTGKISLNAGVDFWTHYFFRGILQENQGVIAQPYGSATFNLFAGDGTLNAINATVGTWNSLHSGPSGTGGGTATDPALWYEADVYGGVSATLLNDWTVGVIWTAYTSPNDSFESIQDITFSLAYADAGFWKGVGFDGFALNPTVAFVIETDGQADQGNGITGNVGGEEGNYLQIGIAPAFAVLESKDFPVTLTLPVTVGLGLDNYYETDRNGDGVIDSDSTFGFVQFGAQLSVPLAFVPADFGAWTAKAGVYGLYLGSDAEFINNGDKWEILGTVGVSMSY